MRTPLINVLHDSKRLVAVALTGPTMLTINIGMLTKLTKTRTSEKANFKAPSGNKSPKVVTLKPSAKLRPNVNSDSRHQAKRAVSSVAIFCPKGDAKHKYRLRTSQSLFVHTGRSVNEALDISFANIRLVFEGSEPSARVMQVWALMTMSDKR